MDTKTQDTIAYDASSAIVLAGKAQSALANACDFVIDSHTMFELASDDLKQVKALQKEVEEKRTNITGPLNQAVKAVNDLFRAPKDYLDKAEATLKRAMVTWTTEQERLAAIARAEAEAAARAERERLAAIEREQQEAARKAQEEAQAAAAAGDQEAAARAMIQAQAAQEQAAIAAVTANVVTAAPAVEAPAKVSGISGRMTFSADVTNLLELVKAVAEGGQLGVPSKGEDVVWEAIGQAVQTWKYAAAGLSINMVSDQPGGTKSVFSIALEGPSTLKTGEGIGIGSLKEEVVKAYAGFRTEAEEAEGFFEGQDVHLVGSIYGGMVFTFTEGKVSRIFFGASAE